MRSATTELAGQARDGRSKPLLALPVLGTGAGGGWDRKGAIAAVLTSRLVDLARELDVDVVLVTGRDPRPATGG